MTSDRFWRWCAKSYPRLLWVLRVRDSRERQAIRDDGARLLEAARNQGPLTLATTWLALVWDLVFVGARHDAAQALRALLRAPGVLLITLFAVGGLITAAGGVYALLAYTVVQRRREIALRMALGASPRRVAKSIVMESLVLAAAGGTIGLIGAAASSRFARTLLFGVAPQDPITLVTAVAVLLAVVVAASWLPARRAASIDPGHAMRI